MIELYMVTPSGRTAGGAVPEPQEFYAASLLSAISYAPEGGGMRSIAIFVDGALSWHWRKTPGERLPKPRAPKGAREGSAR